MKNQIILEHVDLEPRFARKIKKRLKRNRNGNTTTTTKASHANSKYEKSEI